MIAMVVGIAIEGHVRDWRESTSTTISEAEATNPSQAGRTDMSGPVIEIDGVSRRFGSTQALDQVSLCVAEGCVHGLVGMNGAGKTTLIKHVLGLLRAKSGSVRVFGLDPVRHPVEVLRRIGYLSEERDMPEGSWWLGLMLLAVSCVAGAGLFLVFGLFVASHQVWSRHSSSWG